MRKKYQGLSVCTTSISRSRVEESGNEAKTNLPATHMVCVLYSSNALHGKAFAFLTQVPPHNILHSPSMSACTVFCLGTVDVIALLINSK